MSEPSYRINTEHRGAYMNPWEARITRLTDGEHMATHYGDTEQEVLTATRSWVYNKHNPEIPTGGGVYFATEDGEILDAPRFELDLIPPMPFPESS